LAIALDVARAHNGQIDVKSEVGRGTTFIVQLSMQ
jgi:signal transduction histidine kinase